MHAHIDSCAHSSATRNRARSHQHTRQRDRELAGVGRRIKLAICAPSSSDAAVHVPSPTLTTPTPKAPRPVAPHADKHLPVLLDEVIHALQIKRGQTIVDCTLGLGGHSAAMLSRIYPGGRLIGLDVDPANIAKAQERLKWVGGKFDLFHSNFAGLPGILAQAGVENGRVDAVLADIGIASTQIDDPSRGFSYRRDGPLDMRMDPTRGQPASTLIARMSEADLAQAFLELGDETEAPQIARLIVERRGQHPITTTQQLMEIICEARDFTVKRAAGANLHPAARTFQALRILVNRELANLDRLLTILPDVLKPGGIAAIITFHSGEDRRVKNAFRDGLRAGVYADETRDPIIATEAEQRANPRSRSAKLRWVRMAQ